MTTSDPIPPLSPKALSAMAAHVEQKPAHYWERLRERTLLDVFKEAAKRVPAYRAFLKKAKVQAGEVRSLADFATVPVTSKASYLRKYPLAELCWDGTLARASVFSSTSGSTGKPFYFPRLPNLEDQYSVLTELFLRNGVAPSAKSPTLVIIAFGMGVWIGGTLTYRAFDLASRRGYPLSILPAGVNKDEILKALRDLAPSFKQTIIAGYPPFVKDIVDGAIAVGIDVKKLHLRFLFAAEAFSERFRDYLSEKAGMGNVFRDTLNIYGTADIGAMAFETPTSILIRRLALERPRLRERLFGETHKTPTLAQYNPAFTSFEAPEGEVLLTGASAIPLVRYAIGDRGGVHSFTAIRDLLREEGIDLAKEARRRKVPLYELPFVYVYERSDLSTTIYGLQVYPEYLRDVMLTSFMQEFCTGKFQIVQTYSEQDQNQFLEIHIECKKHITEPPQAFIKAAYEAIDDSLCAKSSEYRELSSHVKDRPLFLLVFDSADHPEHFPAGIKQKWVKK